MSNEALNILFPAGRLVWGNLYKGRDKNSKGELLVYKTGAQVGKPRVDFSFGVAFPKNGSTHFTQTVWGKQIYDEAVRAFPRGEWQQPTFSWKVADGDSAVPNKNMKKNCDKVGYPGHWVVSFAGSLAPQLAKLNEFKRAVPLTELNAIKPGYWVQVSGSTKGNTGETAGMYVNHHVVCLVGIDTVIEYGPDLDSMGFGQGVALPAGVSMTNFPIAAALPIGQGVALPAASAGLPIVPAVTQTAVQPHPSFLTPSVPLPSASVGLPVPALPAAVLTPTLPPAEPRMTALAAGASYAQMLAGGWTPELMKQHGMLA